MPTMNSDSVHSGLRPWLNFELDQWQITLGQRDTLIFEVFLALYIMYAGGAFWTLWKRAVGPGVRNDPRQLDDIGQTDAIWIWLGFRRPRHLAELLDRDPVLRKRLGFAALFNFALFLALGMFLPKFLTQWDADATVLSQSSMACASPQGVNVDFKKAFASSTSHFQACWLPGEDALSVCSIEMKQNFHRLPIDTRKIECPLPAGACMDKEQSWSLQHEVTAWSFGQNLENNIWMQRRLLLAPLDLTKFMLFTNRSVKLAFYDPEYDWKSTNSHVKLFLADSLQTLNGPNRYSSEYSGGLSNPDLFAGKPKSLLDIFPGFRFDSDQDARLYMHPLLRSRMGTPFVLLIHHNLAQYSSPIPIYDPLFRARRLITKEIGWMPDNEATAVAVVEEYRFCSDPPEKRYRECSVWQSNRWSSQRLEKRPIVPSDPTLAIADRFEDKRFPHALRSALLSNNSTRRALFTMFSLSSVEHFLRDKTVLPLSDMFQSVRLVPHIDPHNQTANELRAVMEISLLNVRFAMLNLVQGGKADGLDCVQMKALNSDFKNFSYVGTCVTLGVFTLAIFLNWWVEMWKFLPAPSAIVRIRSDIYGHVSLCWQFTKKSLQVIVNWLVEMWKSPRFVLIRADIYSLVSICWEFTRKGLRAPGTWAVRLFGG